LNPSKNPGHGQMMLKETDFFDAMAAIERPFELLKDGNRRLITNRQKIIATFEKAIAEYRTRKDHTINQSGWGLGDE
jgi:hypothetical protein